MDWHQRSPLAHTEGDGVSNETSPAPKTPSQSCHWCLSETTSSTASICLLLEVFRHLLAPVRAGGSVSVRALRRIRDSEELCGVQALGTAMGNALCPGTYWEQIV